ncbi:Ubiquinone biosynthesis hydroxylase, UbiH/UbiF/VisC/COQ6 family [Gluconacetobacter diazotrophicus PA1 5]|uniref:5-demethoxyubiquinol-8 5-hydroxylase UbiM n=1 Tax=Gluconacetobacter diazotrophicus TaxID=33996 RepID=UPI000173BAFE|nr:5-demethoxyubiquinol-8 5-hydroxylase UbiM [Gluconacetobacter diazotrophicus]ACI51395.1 Ubiquinone biosynthesis hydroxylase, UbiH/UbiF/VisC/COQ6 family [Gluconacetobacter diazotrophicus PA1 5]TWA98270.1 ubiquinone biosynthesis UbiH/UbiF/VisC/COQ6 family hydroxylase [Gluconacetobacter diazotrophicus]
MHSDVTIIGGGPAGLATALSLDAAGLSVTVLERAPLAALADPAFDGREIALTHHAVSILRGSGAWARIPDIGISLLREARVETGRHNHPLTFDTHGTGVEALGYLVSNHLIRRALYEEAASRPGIVVRAGVATRRVRDDSDGVTVLAEGGDVACRLAIAADGRFSDIRRLRGIGAIIHDFHRAMLVCRMAHESPHHHVATQWFDDGQTVALLPVNGGASSLVLTLPPDQIETLRTMDRDRFNADIMARIGNRLGEMRLVSTRHVYPLRAVYAHRFAARRFALIGDAAVGMHPITAHGFNLGLKGQEILAQEIVAGMARDGDPGSARVLRRFEARHRMATAPLFAATNGIATLYTRDESPFRQLRRAGLRVADSLAPFKAAVTNMLMDNKKTA